MEALGNCPVCPPRPWTDDVVVCLCAADESDDEGCSAVVDYESWQHARGYKPFIGFWQPRKAGLNKHTGKSCTHDTHTHTRLTAVCPGLPG